MLFGQNVSIIDTKRRDRLPYCIFNRAGRPVIASEFHPVLIRLGEFLRSLNWPPIDFRPATWTDENPHSPVLDLGDILLNSPFELALRTKES